MSALTEEERAELRAFATTDAGNVDEAAILRRAVLVLLDELAAHEAREAELIAALEAGDACGAVGCRALAERDALLEQEARVMALADEAETMRHHGQVWARRIRAALDGGRT